MMAPGLKVASNFSLALLYVHFIYTWAVQAPVLQTYRKPVIDGEWLSEIRIY